jgi:hypothetical protein
MTDKPDGSAAGVQPAFMLGPDTLPDREARNPYLRFVMHLGLPVMVSVFVHTLLLGFLGLKTFQVITQSRVDVGEFEATLTDSLADQKQDALIWDLDVALDAPQDFAAPDALDSLSTLVAPPALDTGDLALGELAGDGVAGGEGLGMGEGALTLLGTGGGAGPAGSGGWGVGLGAGGAGIGSAGVWDLAIRANKVAYVVDFSGSIIVAVDDLRRELKRSIGRLKPAQSFNVIIFYSSGGGMEERVRTESFRPELVPATEENRRGFFAWIDGKAPRGRTQPLEAIKRALAMSPEAVFLFSDGVFDEPERDLGQINRLNRKAGARIYCLVFDDLLLQDTSGLPRETEGSRLLQRIAEANGGEVKIVTGRDLGSR